MSPHPETDHAAPRGPVFSVVRRGYDRAEVETFLHDVQAALSAAPTPPPTEPGTASQDAAAALVSDARERSAEMTSRALQGFHGAAAEDAALVTWLGIEADESAIDARHATRPVAWASEIVARAQRRADAIVDAADAEAHALRGGGERAGVHTDAVVDAAQAQAREMREEGRRAATAVRAAGEASATRAVEAATKEAGATRTAADDWAETCRSSAATDHDAATRARSAAEDDAASMMATATAEADRLRATSRAHAEEIVVAALADARHDLARVQRAGAEARVALRALHEHLARTQVRPDGAGGDTAPEPQ